VGEPDDGGGDWIGTDNSSSDHLPVGELEFSNLGVDSRGELQ
jgi:hypothetical protein